MKWFKDRFAPGEVCGDALDDMMAEFVHRIGIKIGVLDGMPMNPDVKRKILLGMLEDVR